MHEVIDHVLGRFQVRFVREPLLEIPVGNGLTIWYVWSIHLMTIQKDIANTDY